MTTQSYVGTLLYSPTYTQSMQINRESFKKKNEYFHES